MPAISTNILPSSGRADNGRGSVVDARKTYTILHSFTGQADKDGADPTGALIRDAAGNLYGTTMSWRCFRFVLRLGSFFPGTGTSKALYRHRSAGRFACRPRHCR